MSKSAGGHGQDQRLSDSAALQPAWGRRELARSGLFLKQVLCAPRGDDTDCISQADHTALQYPTTEAAVPDHGRHTALAQGGLHARAGVAQGARFEHRLADRKALVAQGREIGVRLRFCMVGDAFEKRSDPISDIC